MIHFTLDHEPQVGEKIEGYVVDMAVNGKLALRTSDDVRVWATYFVSPSGGHFGGVRLADVAAAVCESIT